MDDATKIVNEMVGEPGDVAKFVRSALPDVFLDSLVKWEYDGQGDWLLVLKDAEGDDRILAVVEWQKNEDDSTLYFISPEQFLHSYMSSPDWNWKTGGKWVKRFERNSLAPYYSSLPQVRRALLKEPIVQRRIARLKPMMPTEVESVVDKSVARECVQERITNHLTQEGWTILKSGFHATGRAYIIGRGPVESAKRAVEAVDTAAICAHAAVENIQAGKRAESAPWQMDFTITETEDEEGIQDDDGDEMDESEVKDFMQSYMRKWRLRRHEWSSGAITYRIVRGIGDPAQDLHNSYSPSEYQRVADDKELMQRVCDYMNWLEIEFGPSERYDSVKQWLLTADLAGMKKRWRTMIMTGKVKPLAVEEGFEDALQATVRAAIPAIDDRERVGRLSKRLAGLGITKGDIRLNYHEIRDDRYHYEVGIHVYLQEYPEEWNRMGGPYESIIRPIMKHALDQDFKERWEGEPMVVSAAGGGTIVSRTIWRHGKIPTSPRTQYIYATIGQDAEYRSRSGSRTEAMSPGDLARATDRDAIIQAVVTSMAARMQALGAKGVVYAAKPGPHPLEPSREMVEIGFHLTHAPSEEWYHGRNFQEEWEKMFDEELIKYPDLNPSTPKAYGKVVMSLAGAWPVLKAWIPWSMPGRFYSHKNVNIVLEAMDPSGLYQKSLQGSPLVIKLKLAEMCQKLKEKGYVGEVLARPTVSHPGINTLVIWLYKPNININVKEMKADIAAAWGCPEDEVRDMGFRHPTQTVPRHHEAFSILTTVGAHTGGDFRRKIEETMEPGDLYRKSIRGNPIALKFRADQLHQRLKAMGYHGGFNVQRSVSQLRINSIVLRLYKPGVKLEPEDVRKDVKAAWGQDNTMLVGNVQYSNTHWSALDEPHLVIVISTDLGGYQAAQTSQTYSLFEAIDPSELYRQSLKGTLTATQLAIAGVSNDLAKKGYHGRFSIREREVSYGTYYHFHIYLQAVDPKEEMGVMYQDINTALEAHGFTVDGSFDPRLQQSEYGPDKLDAHVHARIRTQHLMPKEGVIQDIMPLEEGMSPGELYRRSLEYTEVGARLEGDKIAKALAHRGHKGSMVLNTAVSSSQRKDVLPTTPVTIYLDVPNNEPSDAALTKMEIDLSEILWNMGIEQDTTFTQRHKGIKFEWYFNAHRGGIWEAYINLFLHLKGAVTHGDMTWPIGEAIEPGELYRSSLQGTRTGALLDMQKLADQLTQDGFVGNIETSLFQVKEGEPVRVDYALKRPNDLTQDDVKELQKRVQASFKKTGLNGVGIYVRIPGIPYVRHLDTFWLSQQVFLRGNPTHQGQIKLPVGKMP